MGLGFQSGRRRSHSARLAGQFGVSSTRAGRPTGRRCRRGTGAPNIFFYNLDDLRDAFPGAIDPLQFMPKTRAWMADGTRFTQSFVADPSCCPSRSSLMTGRYPAQQRRSQPAGRTDVRQRALDGVLLEERRLCDLYGGQVLDDLAEDVTSAVL